MIQANYPLLITNFPANASQNIDSIQASLSKFDRLKESKDFEQILSQGSEALEEAKKQGRFSEVAEIHTQLLEVSLNLGNYSDAFSYAEEASALGHHFKDPNLQKVSPTPLYQNPRAPILIRVKTTLETAGIALKILKQSAEEI